MLLRNEAMGGDLVLVEKALCVTPVFKTNARGNEGELVLKLGLALFYIDIEQHS